MHEFKTKRIVHQEIEKTQLEKSETLTNSTAIFILHVLFPMFSYYIVFQCLHRLQWTVPAGTRRVATSGVRRARRVLVAATRRPRTSHERNLLGKGIDTRSVVRDGEHAA